MTLAVAEVSSIESSDDIDDEEFDAMVSREELRTLVDQVGKMYEGWDRTQLEIAKLNRNDVIVNARVVGLEGRMSLVERGQGQNGVSMAPGAMSASASAEHEITERRQNVRVPILRATELLDKEKLADEMVMRYAWWSAKARALGVTARQAGWGFAKLAGKAVGTIAVGWIGHLLYELWTKR